MLSKMQVSLVNAFWITPARELILTALQRFNPTQPISTPLFTQESNLEFATRIAKLLARKIQLPTYVGTSLNLSSMGMGGTPEEEMEAFKKVIEVILAKTEHVRQLPPGSETASTTPVKA